MSNEAFVDYINFVQQRHLAWTNRQAGEDYPWCYDNTVRFRKFTNVFRILDPGTQFVLTDLFEDGGPEDILARVFLYRHTNRVDAWRAYKEEVGRYPLVDELYYLHDFWRDNRLPVFNGAYNIYPQSTVKGTSKVTSVVELTHKLFYGGDISAQFFHRGNSMQDRFEILRSNKGVGPFMAMQILTDIGYHPSLQQDENEFVAAGPGATKGAKLIYPELKAVDAIVELWELWQTLGDIYITMPDGTERYPSLMDVQNTCCEYSKFARYSRTLNLKPYQPAHPGPQPEPVYPSHWSTS